MLHIVNKSPTQASALHSCLRLARPGHALLLIEDAVYAASRGAAASSALAQALKTLKVYVLQPDVAARGMSGRLLDGVTPIDYGGFVDLVAEHPNNQSWL
ncbi:MAG: sulfurtransferase complex subunit TusB [Ideonella sp.]|nr:sulfurtransferase complex subunit TusB [Ideonella sp.]MCC7457628.1 sulfurtransferase complex subunit TusB [Nitrospira sp.]